MKAINVYLTFDGNCRAAMEFYKKCFGGELYMMRFSEAPPDFEYPKKFKDKILHATLTSGSAILMASDAMPGVQLVQGNNFSVSVNCESRQEIERLFAAVGKNGKITMPLQDTFWGAYFGVLVDRFGINWMFSLEKSKV